jgi:hypothetical protein
MIADIITVCKFCNRLRNVIYQRYVVLFYIILLFISTIYNQNFHHNQVNNFIFVITIKVF